MKDKITTTFIVLILTVMHLTACGFHGGTTEEYKTPSRQAKELQTKVMDCFINKDKDTLKGFFSEYTLNHCPEIEDEIEDAFAYKLFIEL